MDGVGPVAIDLAMLATPHWLEIRLDPATRTFTRRWANAPLFGAGLHNRLRSQREPD